MEDDSSEPELASAELPPERIEQPKATSKKKAKKANPKLAKRDVSQYVNKQRTLVFASRGITHRDRHFMGDLRDMLPHSKKDVKFDAKAKLFLVNEVAEMKNCNNCIFLEARKGKDLYMWMSKTPDGPSVKFLVENLHTMSELKLTGNCLKGSRPILFFDKTFDTTPAYRLLKEMMTQILGSPKGHPKVKPFIDHQFSFFIADNRIWFRNYQLVRTESSSGGKHVDALIEIGPRFVLNPIRIFAGSFGGKCIYSNSNYKPPRRGLQGKQEKQMNVRARRKQLKKRKRHKEENFVGEDELDNVF
mmetsp:Transcript_30682/g.74760  ORF Transcript_30682/g.74760 Transcript_30682/m.74760 type:complete len:303 (+) Transcript_30682:41-949(+)